MTPWFSAAFAVGCLTILCLGGCAAPNKARARLGPATIPAKYHSLDGQYVVRRRGGTPTTYQLVRVQDGRVLGRAESAIKESDLHTDSPALTMVNVVFSADDSLVCVEEALSGDTGPASRYILFRNDLPAEYRDLGYAVRYLQPEANMWTVRVHYEWPQVLEIDRSTVHFYYPRSKQARNVSLDSVHATDKPATQE